MVGKKVVGIVVGVLVLVVCVSADIIDITLDSNPIYISDELEAYLPIASTASWEPYIGFNGVDIGQGAGNGVDEVVAFSFVFTPIADIDNAYLTLELTPHGTSTDELVFADNNSVRGAGLPGAKFYGNTLLEALPSGVRTSVTFDLMAMDYSDPYGNFIGYEDLSIYLHDGDFNVVYADDAIIHSARLQINTGYDPGNGNGGGNGNGNQGHHVPEPSMLMSLVAGLLMLLLMYVKKQTAG